MRVCTALTLLGLSLGLAACAMPEIDTAAPTVQPSPVIVVDAEATAPEEAPSPTAQVAAEAQPVPDMEAATPAPIDWARYTTVVDEYYVRGNPDAPVLIVDISDFL